MTDVFERLVAAVEPSTLAGFGSCFGSATAGCAANQHVKAHECRYCEGHTWSPGGDDPSGRDTACAAAPCPDRSSWDAATKSCVCGASYEGLVRWVPAEHKFVGSCLFDCGPLTVPNGRSEGGIILCDRGYVLQGPQSVFLFGLLCQQGDSVNFAFEDTRAI